MCSSLVHTKSDSLGHTLFFNPAEAGRIQHVDVPYTESNHLVHLAQYFQPFQNIWLVAISQGTFFIIRSLALDMLLYIGPGIFSRCSIIYQQFLS